MAKGNGTEKILLIDTERGAGGFKSLAHVTILDASPDTKQTAVEKVEAVLWALLDHPEKLQGYSLLVLDTISSLSTLVRHDLMGDGKLGIWQNRGVYRADTRSEYRATADMVSRMLQHFRRLPIATVFVAHEEERLDPAGVLKRGPALSPALLKDVVGWSHVLAHLGQTTHAVTLPNGREIPAGTRRLRVEPDNRYMAKARRRVDLPPLPPVILEPTLRDLREILDGTGEPYPWATLYGPPGVGKTSLVVGATYARRSAEAEEAVAKQEVTDRVRGERGET